MTNASSSPPKGATRSSPSRVASVLVLALSGVSALLALAVGFVLMKGVLAADQGTPKMIEIATAIQEGAIGLPQAAVQDDRA